MTDYSGKFYGWRSVFAGIVVSYVGMIVAVVIFAFTSPVLAFGGPITKNVDCIDDTRICVGSSIDSIESAMSFHDRRPSGIVSVFDCDSGRKYAGGNVEALLRSQCKDDAYSLWFKHRNHLYILNFKMNVIVEMHETIDIWSHIASCLKHENSAYRQCE